MAPEENEAYFREGQRDFDSTVRQALIDTSMETDRTLLALSAGGIGLLVTLTTTAGVTSLWELIVAMLACVTLFGTIVVVLVILKLNKPYLRALSEGKEGQKQNAILKHLDRVVFWMFLLGALLTGAVAVSAGISHLGSKP